MKLNSPISKCKLFNGSQLALESTDGNSTVPVRFVATGSQLRIYKADLIRSLQLNGDIVDFQFDQDSYSVAVFTSQSIQLYDLYDFELVEEFAVPQSEIGSLVGALWLSGATSGESGPSVIVFSNQKSQLFFGYKDRTVTGKMQWKPVEITSEDKKSPLSKYKMVSRFHQTSDSELSLIFWRANRVLGVSVDLRACTGKLGSKFSLKSLPGLAKDKFTCIDMCPSFVTVGTDVGKVLVFDRESLKCLQTVHWHHKGVTAVAVSDNLLLSGGRENAMLVYNIATQQKSVIPRLIEAGLNNLKTVNDSDYWICDIEKLDDHVSIAFSHKLITIELSTCTKIGKDIDLVRFKPTNTFATMTFGSATKENMIISDGSTLSFWNMNEGDNHLICQLQRTHTSFIRFNDGSLCLYAGSEKKLYFYDYDQNDGLSLNTSLSVPTEILKLVPVKDGSKTGADGLISTNNDGTFSFYSRIAAQQIVRDITQTAKPVQMKGDFWKIILINKFRGQPITDAAISDDVLALAHDNQVTLWQLGTFEYLDTRNYPDTIKSICLNANYIAVQLTTKTELVIENLVGSKFLLPLKACTVEHILPVTTQVRSKLNIPSSSLFMAVIGFPGKKRCNHSILITRDQILHYKAMHELENGGPFSNIQYSPCGTSFITSSESGYSLYQLSLIKSHGEQTKKDERIEVKVSEAPAFENIVQSSLFDTSDRSTPPRKIEYSIDTTVHSDIFDSIPCHLIDMDLVFSKIMNDKLHAMVSSMNESEEAMDVDTVITQQELVGYNNNSLSSKDLLQQIEELKIAVA